MYYDVTILKNGSAEVELNDPEEKKYDKITEFTFKLNTIDNSTLVRDRDARCELTIKGIIDDATYKEVCKIAKWAVDRNDPTREITVKVIKDDSTYLRTYEFDNMFCIDYSEEWGANNQNTFTLFAAQAPNYKTLNIYDF